MKLGSRDTHWGEENGKESRGTDDREVSGWRGCDWAGPQEEVWVILGLSGGYKDTNHIH